MHLKRGLSNFEACSVALFTSLALGAAALPARSQTPRPTVPATAWKALPATTSTVPSVERSATASSRISRGPSGAAIPPNRWTAEQLDEAFKRIDDDGDGRLSREEASVSEGLSRHFDQVDSNKDGSVSSAEFDEALK
jgi:hypothetical protein